MSKIWPIIQKHWYNLLVVFSWFYLYTFSSRDMSLWVRQLME